MRIAREGLPFILGAGAVLVGLGLLHWWWAAALWALVTIWVVAFFRDPERTGPRGPQYLIAPADGLVVSVVEVDEPGFLHGKAQRVAIFMNVFNVHVNRYPADGVVAYRHYNPGRFLNAADEKASLVNEQSSVGLDTPKGKVLVRQIAGLIARRIVTDHAPGTAVRQGARMGLIRFGSRVDLFVPPDATVRVQVGQKTAAGRTVVAEWT
ncbi:MAG TPA: phosphatidylserine decarboxylase family protein [Gemmatimonadales bacterium]|nr:phosphatidylserine decarboxylase family protein [Gemmatimonadales bacterium]